MSRPDHAREVRRALNDPWDLCVQLGLLDPGRRTTYKRLGRREVQVLCPWHGEYSPSCSVALGKDGTLYVHCFGCGETGDALTLIAHVHGLDVRRADDMREVLRAGADIGGVALDLGARGTYVPPPRPPRAVAPDEPEFEPLDTDTFDHLARVLLDACPLEAQPDVCAYLRGRELLGEAGGLGALPADDAGRERVRAAGVAAVGEERWRRSGLAWPDTGRWAYPLNRILIPYRERGVDGAVLTLQRRRADDDKRSKYVFPRGRGAVLWPFGVEDLAELAGPDTAVMFTEGAFDVLAARRLCREAGLDRVPLGVPGVDAWRPEWARLAAGRAALVAMDADASGENAVEGMVRDLWAAGAASVARVKPAGGSKDWTEALRKAGT